MSSKILRLDLFNLQIICLTNKCVRVEANVYAGGIWIIWRVNVVSVEVIAAHDQFSLLGVEDGKHNRWLHTIVYMSPQK